MTLRPLRLTALAAVAVFTSPGAAGVADARPHPQRLRVPGIDTSAASDQQWIFVQDDICGMTDMLAPGVRLPDTGHEVIVEGKTVGGSSAPYPEGDAAGDTEIIHDVLTRATFRRYAWLGTGGLAVLLVAGAGFLWALREKLKRQRSEAAIVSAHNATLETRVAERTAELAAANERLTRASDEALAHLSRERELGDMKSSFVTMVSHEFRTPLAVILSSTELLANHLDRLSPERRARQLESIRGSTQQMARLIEEVLLLGKVEAGRMTFCPAAVNLRELCPVLVDEALSATSRRCPVILTIAPEVPESFAVDTALLRHIFSNLLSNAAKYSAPDTEIQWDVCLDRDRIAFRITDHGIGIPASDIPSLFIPFHRAKNVGQVTGTGLGLMITKRCVELHSGEITLISNPGEGTTVTVRLPLHPAHVTP